MAPAKSLVSAASSAPKPLASAPSPPAIPLFGNVLEAWRDPIKLLSDSSRALGDFVRFRFGPFDFVLLSDPALIHHVLVERQKNYVKSRSYDGMKLVLGKGLVTSEGEHWRKQRRLVQPAFHRQRLEGFAQTMATTTSDMLARWNGIDAEFDLHREMLRLTLRMAGLTLFSTDVEGDAAAVGRALDVALGYANTYVEQVVRIPPWVPTPTNLRFRRALRTLDGLVYRLIAERRTSGVAGTDLLGMLLEATDEASAQRMTDGELRDEVMTLMLAGHETTATLLTWTLGLLSRHPDVARKLRDEVTGALGDREPSFEDLPKLAFTEGVIQESMRLYPPAWCIERAALEDDVVGGYAIPKGTTILIAPYTLHRDPRFWVDPERFHPDRFVGSQTTARKNQTFLPFGDGPRICIGKSFAMMEAKIALALIVRSFDVTLVSEEEIALDPGVTLRPKNPVPVRLSRIGAGVRGR